MTAPTLVLGPDAPRADWLAARRSGITATKIAAVAGVHPYLSALEVYDDMAGLGVDVEENTAMRAGIYLEPFVCREWASVDGRQIVRAGLYAHPDRPWQMATPDRLVLKRGTRGWFGQWDRVEELLEAKTALGWGALAWTDQVPEHVQIQVQWQLGVTGLPRASCAALAGPEIRPFTLERDQPLIDDLLTLADDFLTRHVAAERPPTPDGTARLTDYLNRRWQPDPDKTVQLDPLEWADLYAVYSTEGELEKHHATARRAAANRMRQLLGDAEAGVLPGEPKPVVTWKTSTPTRFDLAGHAEAHPDCHDTYRTPGAPVRTLLPKKPKEHTA